MGSLFSCMLSKQQSVNLKKICNHEQVFITMVQGPAEYGKIWDEIGSYQIEFANLLCPNCNMNCYVYNCKGPFKSWKIWYPKTNEEILPISKTG